jgi:tetrahydromethanopterin S-methyltransferase subunit G
MSSQEAHKMSEIETRIALVEQNYMNLEKRIDKVEEKLDNLRDDIKSSHVQLIKVIIGTAGTIVVGLLGTVGVIITNI